MKTTVKEILSSLNKSSDKVIELSGWVRNNRQQSNFGFIELNDGSHFQSIQIVYENDKINNYNDIQKVRIGSAIKVCGKVELTPDRKSPFEIKADDILVYGNSPEDFPIQPKRHTREFLRSLPHLRVRTNLFSAVFRVRSVIADAVNRFFQDRDFVYIHTPIITGDDCEGAGEMFQVSTLDFNNMPKNDKSIDYSKDFYGKAVNLTVSGQLHVEPFTHALRNCYTFGPTFRAEQSNTQRHASEFWMIEPEMAFCELEDNMNIAEDMVKYIIKYTMEKCPAEIDFFNSFVEKGLKDKLSKVVNSNFKRMTHKEAIDFLNNSKEKFENKPDYKSDLASEHEKYLSKSFGPVFITHWPKDIKAFYMAVSEDGNTVKAMDLLVPGSGELIGGSERENRIDVLKSRMKDFNISEEELKWYLDLRRYGGAKTSGFGLGFERMVMYITGIENIRDVIAYPRSPKNCLF